MKYSFSLQVESDISTFGGVEKVTAIKVNGSLLDETGQPVNKDEMELGEIILTTFGQMNVLKRLHAEFTTDLFLEYLPENRFKEMKKEVNKFTKEIFEMLLEKMAARMAEKKTNKTIIQEVKKMIYPKKQPWTVTAAEILQERGQFIGVMQLVKLCEEKNGVTLTKERRNNVRDNIWAACERTTIRALELKAMKLPVKKVYNQVNKALIRWGNSVGLIEWVTEDLHPLREYWPAAKEK